MSPTAVESATGRTREVFAAVATAKGRQDAVDALARLLSVPAAEAEQVLAAPLESFVGRVADASAEEGAGFALHPFTDSEEHAELYRHRAADPGSEPAGRWDDARVEQERRDGLQRIEHEQAMWFVAVDTARDRAVGLVFGEQEGDNGDIDVAIWVHPEERRKGYGMRSLRESRSALAGYFPGVHVVVRAPLAQK